ncbi:MAG: hypothetical protein HYX65_10185 [Gemmatimonadetes bacterium]|nr:hypothetical protein [Gemmatimonadota bacterium]
MSGRRAAPRAGIDLVARQGTGDVLALVRIPAASRAREALVRCALVAGIPSVHRGAPTRAIAAAPAGRAVLRAIAPTRPALEQPRRVAVRAGA